MGKGKDTRMKVAAYAAAALVTLVGFQIWAGDRDAEMRQASAMYEACVQKEYGMTPIKWYEQHQKYPRCGN